MDPTTNEAGSVGAGGFGVGAHVIEGDDAAPLALTERVAELGKSTAALMTAHVASLEASVAGKSRIEKRAAVVEKVGLPGADTVAASNTLPTTDESNTLFTNSGAIFPPYDPETLVMLFEHSNALRSNVDAYVTNIEAFGHRFEPAIDLEAADVNGTIGDAMFLDRLHASGNAETAQASYPTPEEIKAKKEEIVHAMRLEKAKIENFVDGAVPESSFVDLREKSRVDHEITGNAYWEVLRNARGDVSQFTYVPAHSVRLLPVQPVTIEVRARQRVSALSFENTTKKRRFRFYVQVVYNRLVYFKEFGDPRAMNAHTGRLYASAEAMQADDPKAIPATELVHVKVHSARTPYGIPRWIGNLLSVLGSRSAEEVNYLYFDNKAVPPLAVLVSGGRLTESATKKIESYVKDHIKGKENFHRILIIEAQGASSQPGMPDNGRVRVQLERLTDAQQQDALFQDYDERNIDKLGSSFRLPRLVRGDVRDFNRATAEAALEFAEMQVFQPERNRFDEFMNRQILPALGVRFWKFVSNTPVSKDPETLTTMIASLVQAGVLVPAEARELIRDVFNREFKRIDDDWTKIPLQLTLAGLTPQGRDDFPVAEETSGLGLAVPTVPGATPASPADRNLAAVAANLAALRDKLRGAAKSFAAKGAKERKIAFDQSQVIMIPVAKEELDKWFEQTGE